MLMGEWKRHRSVCRARRVVARPLCPPLSGGGGGGLSLPLLRHKIMYLNGDSLALLTPSLPALGGFLSVQNLGFVPGWTSPACSWAGELPSPVDARCSLALGSCFCLHGRRPLPGSGSGVLRLFPLHSFPARFCHVRFPREPAVSLITALF